MANPLFGKSVVSIDDLTLAEIELILASAKRLKEKPNPDLLKNKIMASCFFEPSTRTRLSFESSMLRLGGQVIGFADAQSTSTQKGESLEDTMRVMSAYADVLVCRHPQAGSAHIAAQVSNKPVINAGDGSNQHPSQTLLDLFSIQECQGRLHDLHIALVGDLKYSRTVHSLVSAYRHFANTTFYFVAPDALAMPQTICQQLTDAGVQFSVHQQLEDIIDKVDIVYMTRLQQERFANDEKIANPYQLDTAMLQSAKASMRILHPLPRLDEITTAVDDTQHAYYFQQAENGVTVRQALLSLLLHA